MSDLRENVNGKILHPEKLEKYQACLLKMIDEFDRFCRLNGLEWFLAGGSALGAVRHGGFIPWDDDIDLAMPRPDFERLEEVFAGQGNRLNELLYSPVEAQLLPDAPIGHLYDPGSADGDYSHAAKLDIHPLDGVPGDGLKKKQERAALVYYMGVYRQPKKNKGFATRLLSEAASRLVPGFIWRPVMRRAKRQITRFDFYSSDDIVSTFGAAGYEKEIIPKEWFLPSKKMSFEGMMLPVPGKAELYLERLYGDWKKLPPEDERKPQHDSYLYVTDGAKFPERPGNK